MCGIHAAQDLDDQPSSSFRLPMDNASFDSLADIDDHIASPSTEIQLKKVLKLFPFPWVKCRQYYHIEGDKFILHQTFSLTTTKVEEIKTFENLGKTDMVFSCFEIEDLEAAARTLLEVISCVSWWFYAAKFLPMQDTTERLKVKCLFVTDARNQLLVAKTASTL